MNRKADGRLDTMTDFKEKIRAKEAVQIRKLFFCRYLKTYYALIRNKNFLKFKIYTIAVRLKNNQLFIKVAFGNRQAVALVFFFRGSYFASFFYKKT